MSVPISDSLTEEKMGRILGMVVFTVGLCVVLLSWLLLGVAATTLAQIPSSRGPAVFAAALLAAEVPAASAVLLRARNRRHVLFGLHRLLSGSVWSSISRLTCYFRQGSDRSLTANVTANLVDDCIHLRTAMD